MAYITYHALWVNGNHADPKTQSELISDFIWVFPNNLSGEHEAKHVFVGFFLVYEVKQWKFGFIWKDTAAPVCWYFKRQRNREDENSKTEKRRSSFTLGYTQNSKLITKWNSDYTEEETNRSVFITFLITKLNNNINIWLVSKKGSYCHDYRVIIIIAFGSKAGRDPQNCEKGSTMPDSHYRGPYLRV